METGHAKGQAQSLAHSRYSAKTSHFDGKIAGSSLRTWGDLGGAPASPEINPFAISLSAQREVCPGCQN